MRESSSYIEDAPLPPFLRQAAEAVTAHKKEAVGCKNEGMVKRKRKEMEEEEEEEEGGLIEGKVVESKKKMKVCEVGGGLVQ